MKKLLTNKQTGKAVKAFKALLSMPERKDIKEELVLSTKANYELVLADNKLIRRESWVDTHFDLAGDKENVPGSQDEEVLDNMFLQIIEFFDLTAMEIVELQKKLQ